MTAFLMMVLHEGDMLLASQGRIKGQLSTAVDVVRTEEWNGCLHTKRACIGPYHF